MQAPNIILMDILRRRIADEKMLSLLGEVVGSFRGELKGIGLPLGNLTSQLLVNIYMNEFDQFVKHALRAKNYVRYADDFVMLSPNRMWLEIILPEIESFLWHHLKLRLHPHEVFITTFASGVDFLGWVHFPEHRVLRTATKRRMFRRVAAHPESAIIQSYRGLLAHGNARQLGKYILEKNPAAV